jgi:hypothetical protein
MLCLATPNDFYFYKSKPKVHHASLSFWAGQS